MHLQFFTNLTDSTFILSFVKISFARGHREEGGGGGRGEKATSAGEAAAEEAVAKKTAALATK